MAFLNSHLTGVKISNMSFICLCWAIFLESISFGQSQQFDNTNAERNTERDLVQIFSGASVYELTRFGENDITLVLQAQYANHGIDLGDLRFLLFPEIQRELNLSKNQLDQLQSVLDEVAEYDLVWKWELAIPCVPAREKAINRSEELYAKVNGHDGIASILVSKQLERLKQLQRRYLLFSMNTMTGNGGYFFRDQIASDSRQASRILQIVQDGLEAIDTSNSEWETNELLAELKILLGPDNLKVSLETLEKRKLFARNPFVRNAQMRKLFRYEEIDNLKGRLRDYRRSDEDTSKDFQIIEPLILPNGKFIARDKFERCNKRAFGGLSKWQRLGMLLVSDETDWFALVDFQVDEIGQLIIRHEHPEDPPGVFSYAFVGQDKIIEFMRNAPAEVRTSERAYRDYVDELVRLEREMSKAMENGIKAALLPHQLNALQFSIGATKCEELGIYVLLSEELLGKDFQVPGEKLERFGRMIRDRREKEISELNRLESRILRELSSEQRRTFENLFGEPVDFFPTFVGQLTDQKLLVK